MTKHLRSLMATVALIATAASLIAQQPAPRPEPKLELVVQTGHSSVVRAVALSSDGSRVVTGSSDKTAIIWDALTGQALRTFAGHTEGVEAVAISGNGEKIVTACSLDQTVVVWDAITGQKLHTFPGPRGNVEYLSLSTNGERLLAKLLADLVVWDVRTEKQLFTIRQKTQSIDWAILSGDGTRLLSGNRRDRTAILWDAQTGQRILTLEGHTSGLSCVALSADGMRALTGSFDKTAILWDGQTGQKLMTFQGHDSLVRFVALSSDGKRAITAGSLDRTALAWDADTGKRLNMWATDLLGAVSLSGDGKHLLTADSPTVDNNRVALWDISNERALRTFTGHIAYNTSVALSRNGRWLITGSYDATAVLWDATTGQCSRTLTGHTHRIFSVALNPDGSRALTGGVDKTAMFWDTTDGRMLRILTAKGQGDGDWVLSVALSEDGSRALIGRSENRAELWDTHSGQKLQSFTTPGAHVNSVALSNDGKRVLTVFDDRDTVLWDAESGKKVQTFREPGHRPNCVALSGDGKRALMGSVDKTAILWDTATANVLQTFKGHNASLTSVVLSENGTRVLTGSMDRTAVVWDAQTGNKLQTFQGNGGMVGCVALSKDGSLAITVDGSTRLWDTATGKELCSLISIDAGTDWLVVTPDGFFDGSLRATRFLSYRLSGTLDFVPLERYQQKYWRPGLLAAIMRGNKPKPTVNINKTLPPRVRFADALKPGMQLQSNKLSIEAIAETRSEFPVKAFRLIVDGRPYRGQLGVQKLAEPKVGESRAKWDIELEPGKHTLKVMVDTEYVQGASDEIEVKYVGGSTGPVELPALYILAIGISDYPDATRKLDFAHLDAQAVADAFRAHSKTLFKEIDAKVVTNKDANRRGIFAGMQWLREKMAARPNSIGILFFAGHGEKDPADGMLYLLPHDFEEKNYGASAIEATTFKNQLASIPGRLMLILDACHSGETGKEKTRSSGELTDQLIRDLTAEEHGLIVFASALGHQKAQESREFKHGMFTQAMIEALSGKAPKSADGAVYLDSMIGYVGNRVRDLTKGYQSPVPGRPIAIRDFPISKP